MVQHSIEQRVEALELKLANVEREVRDARGTSTKDWRLTIGAFTDDEDMKDIMGEAMRLREDDGRVYRRG